MMMATTYRKGARRGAALIEAVVATAVVGVVLAVFSLAATDSRRNASPSDSINNLKQFAWASSQYTADCNERLWSYSGDLQAAAAQATDIINRRTNLDLITPVNWIPHVLYSHLVLVDHLNLPLPTPWAADPADENRMVWQRCASEPNPQACFFALPPTQRPGSNNESLRYMVSSSYQLGPAFFSEDQRQPGSNTLESALTTHYTYNVGHLPLGDRHVTQVAFPSRKVMMWDQYQRHFGARVAYYAYAEARVPVLMVDGSAGVRATSESNPGFYPNNPQHPSALRFNYAPRVWELPTLSGGATDLVTGYYQWTRGGLTGNDFGAPEVCTGQIGCAP
jgi:hypothetical protein